MVNGKLEKTIDEQMKEFGHANLVIAWTPISNGTFIVNSIVNKYRVDSNPTAIVITINDRVVVYSIKDMITDSLLLITDDEKSGNK